MGSTKMVKKDKLEFQNGLFFTKKGKIVAIDPVVVEQINQLEKTIQLYMYMEEQPPYQPEPSPEGFEFKSAFNKRRVELRVQTPLLEQKYEEAKQLMEEIDARSNVEVCNEMFERYNTLVNWIESDDVLVTVNPTVIPERIDAVTLGNPLELTTKAVVDIIVYMASEGKAVPDKEDIIDD